MRLFVIKNIFIFACLLLPLAGWCGGVETLADQEALARGLYGEKKYDEAIKNYRAALALVVEKDYASGIPFLLNCGLGDCYVEKRKYKDALSAYKQAIEVALKGPYDEYALLEAYESIMCIGMELHYPAVTIEYGEQLLDVLRQAPPELHFYARVNGSFLIAEAWMSKKSYAEAAIYYRQSLELLKTKKGKTRLVNIPACMALTSSRLSLAETRNRSLRNGVQYLLQALNLLIDAPELADTAKFPELNKAFAESLAVLESEKYGVNTELGRFYQSLAGYFEGRGKTAKFTSYHERAVDVLTRTKANLAAASSYARLALAYNDKSPSKAMSYIGKALALTGAFAGKNEDAALVFCAAGKVYERNGIMADAAPFYDRAITALDDNSPPGLAAEIFLNAGRMKLVDKKYDLAVRCLTGAADYGRQTRDRKNHLQAMQAFSLLTDALVADGKIDQAIKAVNDDLTFRLDFFDIDDDPELLVRLGELYMKKGDYAMATQTYQELVWALVFSSAENNNPKMMFDGLLRLADAELKIKEPEDAERYCDRAAILTDNLMVDNIESYRRLIDLYVRCGSMDKAKSCFAQAVRRLRLNRYLPPDQINRFVGDYYSFINRPGKGTIFYAKAALLLGKSNPAEAVKAWHELGLKWYKQRGYVAAGDCFNRAMQFKNIKVEPRLWADINCLRGDCLRFCGEPAAADKQLRTGIALAVKAYGEDSAYVAAARLHLGETLIVLKQYANAEKELLLALKGNERSVDTSLACYWGLARACRAQGKDEPALTYGKKAVKIALQLPVKNKLRQQISRSVQEWSATLKGK